MENLTQSRRDARNALGVLEKSIKRASEDVKFLRTRKANLMAIKGTDPMAIQLVDHALATAEQELASLRKTAEELRLGIER